MKCVDSIDAPKKNIKTSLKMSKILLVLFVLFAQSFATNPVRCKNDISIAVHSIAQAGVDIAVSVFMSIICLGPPPQYYIILT